MPDETTKSPEGTPSASSKKKPDYWPKGAPTNVCNEERIADAMDLVEAEEKRLGRKLTLEEAAKVVSPIYSS